MDEKMFNRLHDPIAKGAIPTISPIPPLQPIASPNPILDEKPREELDLGRNPNLPHGRTNRSRNGAKELSLIGGLGRVCTIFCEIPIDLIQSARSKATPASIFQRAKYCCTCSTEKVASMSILAIQALLSKALLTFHLFLVEMWKMRGAISLGFSPCSQGASQNGVFSPLPTRMVVAA
jgi:hypothetical protein